MSNVSETEKKNSVRDGRYIPTLDGWRAIAILVVIFAHGSDSIFDAIGINVEVEGFHQIGLFGVQVFFGLSGVLITSRLVADEAIRGKISLSSFYIRRAFRILPASLVFLCVVGVLAWFEVLPVSLGRWLSTVFFFANYSSSENSWYLGHFWSLAVEEHFYFIWPIVFSLLAKTKRRVMTVIIFSLFVALWRMVDFKFRITGSSPALFWGRTDIQADSIAWGVVIALLYGDLKWRGRLEMLLRNPVALPGLSAVLISCLVVSQNADWKLIFLLISIKSIVIPLVILAGLVNRSTYFHMLLETSVFKLIGRLSYSLYLWQQMFLVFAPEMVKSMGLLQMFPINFVAAIGCATLSMLLIENPLIKFGHRLSNKLSDRKNR